MRRICFLFIVFSVVFFSKIADAQIIEKVPPFIKNYTASEFNAHPEIWTVTQDKRGLMYFGNSEGVLEFDGVTWRIIDISNKSIVKSLSCDKNGRVYVGAQGEIGYLAPNKLGKMQYVSLVDKIPERFRNFGDVWQTFCAANGDIWFRSPELVFLFKNDKVRVLTPNQNQTFKKAFFVNEKFYVRETNKGLLRYEGRELKLVPDGEKFKDDRVYVMLGYDDDNTLLVGSRNEGLHLYDGREFKTWDIPVNEHIKQSQLYGGISLLGKQYFAITNLQSGLLILDRSGHVIQHINQEKGLLNDAITNLILDNNNNLWLSTVSGITFIETNSDFGLFDKVLGIKGTVYSAKLFKDKLCLGTTSGLYVKSWSGYSNPLETESYKFSKVPQTEGQALDLDTINGKLIIGHYTGLLTWDGNKIEKVANDIYVWKILRLSKYKNKFIAGTRLGLCSFEFVDGQCRFIGRVGGFSEDIPFLAEDSNGNIWASTPNGELFRLSLNERLTRVVNDKRYGKINGLPLAFDNYVFQKKGGILLATEHGIFDYVSSQDKFVENKALNTQLGTENQIKKIVEDSKGNIWFQTKGVNKQTQKISYQTGVCLKQRDGDFKLLKNSYRLNDRALENILVVGENILVFGTATGGIYHHFNPRRYLFNEQKVFIRRVSASYGKKDTLFFLGTLSDSIINNKEQSEVIKMTIPYSLNDLNFQFSSTSYLGSTKNEYQFYLKGYDKEWSEWTKETQKSYTNLPEGKYTFYVRSRDIFQLESKETTFEFRITPPWYRTIGAYIVYGFLTVLLIWFFVRRSEIQKRRLRKKVQKATAEIASQKTQIEEALSQQTAQNEKLVEQEELLKANMLEIRKAQAELNAQFEAINNSPIIKTEYTPYGKLLNINGAFTELTGYYPEELMGKDHRAFISKEVSDAEYEKFWDELREKKQNTGEFKRFNKNGEPFWVNSTYFAVRDDRGKISKVIALSFDITESKTLLRETQEQAKALKEKDEEMQQNLQVLLQTQEMMKKTQVELDAQLTSIDSSTILKAEFDLNGYLVSANDAYLAFFGYQRENSLGNLNHRMLLEAEYSNSFEYEYFWNYLKEGASKPGEFLRINKDYEEVWINATYTPVKNEEGRVYKIIELAFDITDSRKLMNQIKVRNKKLQDQEQIILRSIKKLKATTDQLEQQNKQMTQKNELITASINYAKTIQNAVLPTENTLLNFFSDCFILYLPKDIVSGDFYWYTKVNNEHFLAVVDCTGHGVPGAFMSMIGNALLSDIVNNQRISSPAIILEKLNKGIISRLKQETTGNYDGMDISLCRFKNENTEKVEVVFAGAKLPLIYLEDNEIRVVKGTRKSIGGWQPKDIIKEFENNVLHLNRGTQLYLFSDGYMDTANLKRKKIGTKGFHDALSNIHTKPNNEQKQILNNILNEHKQGGEQRDDITVFGVRL